MHNVTLIGLGIFNAVYNSTRSRDAYALVISNEANKLAIPVFFVLRMIEVFKLCGLLEPTPTHLTQIGINCNIFCDGKSPLTNSHYCVGL